MKQRVIIGSNLSPQEQEIVGNVVRKYLGTDEVVEVKGTTVLVACACPCITLQWEIWLKGLVQGIVECLRKDCINERIDGQ